MKWSVLLLLLVTVGCLPRTESVSYIADAGRTKGEFRGVQSMNFYLYQSVFVFPEQQEAIPVESIVGPAIETSAEVLGQRDRSAARDEYRGVKPNPMNMMLWFEIMATIRGKMVDYCEGDSDNKALFERRRGDRSTDPFDPGEADDDFADDDFADDDNESDSDNNAGADGGDAGDDDDDDDDDDNNFEPVEPNPGRVFASMTLRDGVADNLRAYCADTSDRTKAQAVWDDFIGFTAPASAFNMWWSVYEGKDADQSLLGLLMSPYLLLVH